ncbi:hypothetical protein [Arthrobacter oryzae]|uniref:hypothetical protein n=1 Tax=Arthrobacter oryzae TaxID=409290 RepID=UPI00285F3E9A|nr:hypothetical protein [Arthrobacter oryzae]MDR6505126.1 hypothetical protein [Arthrobacter oryzae]
MSVLSDWTASGVGDTITAAVAGTNGTAWTAVSNCSKDDFEVGTPSFTATEIPTNGSITGTVTLRMIDRYGVNQDGCKGATVPLHFAAS